MYCVSNLVRRRGTGLINAAISFYWRQYSHRKNLLCLQLALDDTLELGGFEYLRVSDIRNGVPNDLNEV